MCPEIDSSKAFSEDWSEADPSLVLDDAFY